MIHKFTVQNFYSIGKEVEIDLTTTSSKVEAEELYSKSPVSDRYVSKIEYVGGANASGKTNVLRVIAFLKFLIVKSINKPDDGSMYFIHFLPYTKNNKNTKFSISFSVDQFLYDYHVELNINKILHESLSLKKIVTKRATSTVIFDRIWRNNRYSVKLSPKLGNVRMLKNLEQLMIDHKQASFISLVANFDDTNGIIRRVFDFWSGIVTNIDIFGVDEANFSVAKMSESALKALYNDSELYNKAREILKKYDIGFDEIIEGKPSKSSKQDETIYMMKHMYKSSGIGLPMKFESSGTQRLIILIRDILTALSKKNGVAVLDEFDAFLHPNMFEELIELFMSKNTNPNDTQLIFSSQQYAILSELDKQQIILTEKNEEGETEAWRLDEVDNVSNSDNFYTKYLNGAYGGVPRIES